MSGEREKKFTPGPWTLNKENLVIMRGFGSIASVYTSLSISVDQAEANADLLTTAPELLKALEDRCEVCLHEQKDRLVPGDLCSACEVDKVIKKAYGETE